MKILKDKRFFGLRKAVAAFAILVLVSVTPSSSYFNSSQSAFALNQAGLGSTKVIGDVSSISVVDVTQSVSPKAAGRTANAVSCAPPSAFDWLITQDCTLLVGQDVIAPANVIVERDVTLIISSGVSLKVNSEHHLRIMKGGKVIVRTGGSFLIKERKSPPDWVSIGADHHFNGDLTFVHRANPGFLDVHFGASLPTVLLPSGPRFNQLLMYDPQFRTEITGDLAHSWDVAADGQTLTFHLNEANWHDGVPVTADDIVFSLDRMAETGVTRGRVTAIRDFYERGTATVVDARTVNMPLKFPSVTALGWLAVDYFKIYPRHVVLNKTQDELNCCYENNLGSGPWKFREWIKGDSFSFDRNDDYFKNPQPFFDGMKVFIIEDAASRLAALETQQVMGWLGVGATTLQDMIQVQQATGGRMRAQKAGAGSLRGFWMHLNKPPFDDPRVRKAVYLAVDRQAVMAVSNSDQGVVGNYFPPGYANTEAEILALPGWRQPKAGDIAEAQGLMAEAGFPDGFQVTWNVDQGRRIDAEVVSAQLLDTLGIETELQIVDSALFFQRLRDGTHNFSNRGTGPSFKDPSVVLTLFYAQNVLRNPENFSDPRLDPLIEAQARELDQEARRQQFREMEAILSEGTSHYINLYWVGMAGALDFRIQNFKPPWHPHTIWTYEHVWWDEDAPLLGPDAPPNQ